MPDLTRRSLLGLLPLAGLAAACGATEPAGTGATGVTPSAGPWTFTDGIGQTISLDQRPTRIAAYGDQAAALIAFGIRPVAMFHYVDPADERAFDDIDLTGVEIIGTQYGEIDLERLAAAQPDLVLTTSYRGEKADLMYGFKDKTQMAKVREIAPVAGILQTGTALDVIHANEGLVASLGVDVDGGRVAADRADFEAAGRELTAAAASGLTVVPIYGEDANLYYAKAADDPALAYYAELGVAFTPVTGKDYYWQIVSWENADTYDPDLFLYSARDSYKPEQLQAKPTFARLSAARAGQLHPWTFTSMSYPSQAAYMRQLAGWLGSDRKVT